MNNRKKLTDEQLKEAENLRKVWDRQSAKLGLTQAEASKKFGFANQSAVSQYLNARIPLNIETSLRFAKLLQVPVGQISEKAAELISTDHEVKRSKLGIPSNDHLVEVSQEAKKIVGDFHYIVIDKDATQISDGIFLVAVGGSEVMVEITRSEGGYIIRGASQKPMEIPDQALQLISIRGRVTHKIYVC